MKKILLLVVACISLLSCTEDSILNNWSFGFPGSPKITSSKSSLTFSSDGGTENITINSNFTWKMISKPEWINVSPSSSAKGTTELTITAEATNASEAKGTIVLGEPETSTTLSIEVGIDDKISADVTTLDFSADGESQVVSITSNFNWQVLSKPEWITISPSSGSNGITSLTITAEKSASTSARTETLTIGKESSATVSITVNQAAATVDVVDDVESDVESETFTVNGVSFKMIKVEGGTFEMSPDQLNNSNHSVTLSTYYIGETEVPYDLWEAVMGPDSYKNPYNQYVPAGRYPAHCVTWNECQDFVTKLSSLTGKTFRLPTEAEWVYAARGGNKSKGYIYSGSNDIEEVAWYKTNSHDLENGMYDPNWGTHAVARKKPNELGLYDMTGNLCEWTLGYDSNNEAYVCRGGCWWSDAWDSRIVNSSTPYRPDVISVNIGLRVVMTDSSPVNNTSSETVNVSGVSFKMIKVEGGTFKMGDDAAIEQYPTHSSPAHSVTLSTYYIGETEVTQELWETVMGKNNNPSYMKSARRPVEQVSWDGCQDFVAKLSSMTGRNFRLPTEAEWEYAARGGNKSKGYKYSGSNNIDDVAWYDVNSYNVGSASPNYGTHTVATKQANELGLYDMSGNVREWCYDWYSEYSAASVTNPTGPASGSYRVIRDGSWGYEAEACLVSNRQYGMTTGCNYFLGFRLVMTK